MFNQMFNLNVKPNTKMCALNTKEQDTSGTVLIFFRVKYKLILSISIKLNQKTYISCAVVIMQTFE